MSVPIIAVRWWDGSQSVHADLTVTLIVGATDYSARVSGQLKITAEEESARLANFSITPVSAVEMDALDGAAVTIDIKVDDGASPVTYRRFTGAVATWSYNAGQRLISITARDEYQETIKACASAAEVETLIGGHATISAKLASWSSDKPNPTSYFNALLATVQGSYYITGSGVWTHIPWTISATPAASFAAGDVFDDSLSIDGAEKSGLPASINAKLTARLPRLWAAEVNLAWTGLDYVLVGRGRGSWPTVQSIQSAMSSADGWLVKGTPTYTHPNYAYVIPLEGGGNAAMAIANPESIAIALSATMYSRWYQEVDVTYSISIDLGGASDADESIADSFSSEFDASSWEQAPSSQTTVNIYAWNAPVVEETPTGYEGLPAPWPTANHSMFHYPDIGDAGLTAAARAVVAKAVRVAASGLRKRRVSFERIVDPRFDLGATLAINAFGVAARGQLVSLVHLIDFDAASGSTQYTLACPAGNGSSAGFSATVTMPTSSATISPAAPTLTNWVGADTGTPTNPDVNTLLGAFSNTGVNITGYSATAPGYQQQFRIALPEIPASYRDPAIMDIALTADYAISSGALTVTI